MFQKFEVGYIQTCTSLKSSTMWQPKGGHHNKLSPHTPRIYIFFIWAINMMVVGKLMFVMCLKAKAQVKALFASCGWIVLWPPNDMFINPYGSIENVAMGMLNLSMEGKSALMSQMEGVQISTPSMNNIKCLNKSTNNNTWTFQ